MAIESVVDVGFTNELARSNSAELAVQQHSKTGLGRRKANKALVKCTPKHAYVV